MIFWMCRLGGIFMATEFQISFPDFTAAEQTRLVSSLSDKLREVPQTKVSIVRERSDTQDPGTILSIILAAPAVIVAVKALATWAMRNNQPSVVISGGGKKIELKNLSSSDVPKAIEALKGLASNT
jgi:hypothetical protein